MVYNFEIETLSIDRDNSVPGKWSAFLQTTLASGKKAPLIEFFIDFRGVINQAPFFDGY
jgi:hypothetical protein